MDHMNKKIDEHSEQETARRRDQALQRALDMPPKPHKQKSSGGGDEESDKPKE